MQLRTEGIPLERHTLPASWPAAGGGGLLYGLLPRGVAASRAVRRLLAAAGGALAVGLLLPWAWMLITWTPLPPLQFAAPLQALAPAQRDAACTGLALRRTAGPYDASMLAYRFDARAGLCVSVEDDGFRTRVMEARELHRQRAGRFALLCAGAVFLGLLLRRPAPGAALPGAFIAVRARPRSGVARA